MAGLFGGSEEEEKTVEEDIPEDQLCDKCGERRAVWQVVGEESQLCNTCTTREKRHLTRGES